MWSRGDGGGGKYVRLVLDVNEKGLKLYSRTRQELHEIIIEIYIFKSLNIMHFIFLSLCELLA